MAVKKKTKVPAVRVLGEVVRTVELEPVAGDLRLRIEVLKLEGRPARYTTRVWKLENYRVRPSFQGKAKTKLVADEQVLVPFDHIIDEVVGNTVAKVMAETLRRLRARFG